MPDPITNSHPLTKDGCWAEYRTGALDKENRPILFLDRDGVVIEEKHYLSDPDLVCLHFGVDQVIKIAQQQGWIVGLVTNQSGIGRGYFGWDEFFAVQTKLDDLLELSSVALDFVLACPFHPEGTIARYTHSNHGWRKPNPGMLETALDHLNGSTERSMIIGDQASDINAARRAGLGAAIHVLTGHGHQQMDEAKIALQELPSSAQYSSIGDPAVKGWLESN